MLKKQNRKFGKKVRVLLTSGHAAATAYAVIEELKSRKNIVWEIYFIGASKAIEGKKISTLEFMTLPKLGVTSYPLFTGRIQRRFSFWTIPSLIKIPFGLIHALFLVFKIKPEITLSFGGYAAFPVVLASWLSGVPVVVHEQTVAAGRANRLSSIFAKQVAMARLESQSFFPRAKSVEVGNPVSKEVAKIEPKISLGEPPVIFITGGSRGSMVINDLLQKILERLLANFYVIHQTGVYQLGKFTEIKRSLNKNLAGRYQVYGSIEPWNWGQILEKADIIISRAGANVVSEIMVIKRPAILIPLPFTYQDEQTKNALYAQNFGIASVLTQDSLTSDKMLKQIYEVRANWYKIIEKVRKKVSPDRQAAAKLVDIVEKFI